MASTKASCIRARARTAASACTRKPPPAFFALVQIGTPVNIARTQPEDAQFGHFVRTLDQSRDPDPPRVLLMSPSWFQDPPGPLLDRRLSVNSPILCLDRD